MNSGRRTYKLTVGKKSIIQNLTPTPSSSRPPHPSLSKVSLSLWKKNYDTTFYLHDDIERSPSLRFNTNQHEFSTDGTPKKKKKKKCPWPVGAELAVICSSFLLICWVVSCVKQTLIQPDDPQAGAADAAVKGSASSTTSARGEGGSAPFVPLTQTQIFSR